jgi:molecular chaperone DnaK
VETRNQLDTLVYQSEKDTTDWADKISADAKSRLEAAIERAKKALKQDELSELQSARDELMQAVSAAGQQFYQAQAGQAEEAGAQAAGQQPEAEPAASSAPRDEDVVEADYEIVDEEKK